MTHRIAPFCAAVVGYFVNAVLIRLNLVPQINNFNIVLELLTFLLPVQFSYIPHGVMWQFCLYGCG
jgi:hypothetical protein